MRDVGPLGVVCQLTPRGVTQGAWEAGLAAFAASRPRRADREPASTEEATT
jgi:hypothetical protein